MTIIEILSIGSDLAIVFLLAIQSYVLWVLKKPILETSKNSVMFKRLFKLAGPTDSNYPQELIDAGIPNCKDHTNKSHIHSANCF